MLKLMMTQSDKQKIEFDRQLTELEKTELVNHEQLIEMISSIEDEQTRELFFKLVRSNVTEMGSSSKIADELEEVYILITDEKFCSFFQSQNQKDEIPYEIKANNMQRVYGKRSPLIVACEKNNMTLVQYLIDRGENINVQDVDGKTPLMKACILKHFELAQMLLQLGADVQIEDENGENAAFFINDHFDEEIKQGDLAYQFFTTLLNSKKIDINKPNKFGETLLFFACYRAHLDIVKFLVENGINCKIDALFIERSHVYDEIEICKCLIDKVPELIDLNDIDKPCTYMSYQFDSLLETICQTHSYQILVEILFDKGLLSHVCVNRLFRLAICSFNLEFTRYFLNKGVNLNQCDEAGDSPLILATKITEKEEDFESFIRVLVENGANVKNSGKSAIYYACRNDSFQISEYLVQKGADLSNHSKNGESLFSKASFDCKYLLCTDVIRQFYNLFQSQNALREKVVNQSIKNCEFLEAFQMIYYDEDKEFKSKALRDEGILEYFATFDFREKFVADVLTILNDRFELLKNAKIKIEMRLPQIKTPVIKEFNLAIKNTDSKYIFTASADSFMEKLREHKELIKVKYGDKLIEEIEMPSNCSELEEFLLDDNLSKIINEDSDVCAKLKTAHLLYEKINSVIEEVTTISDQAHRIFDLLSQSEVRFFLNLSI